MDEQNQNSTNPTTSGDVSQTIASDGNTELDTCKKQAEEYLNNWKRERADFVNYKKEEVKRMQEFSEVANLGLLLELLEVLDNLYLAAKEIGNSGLDQVVKGFEDLLSKNGVEKIRVGDKFDPMLHEAVEGLDGDKVEEIRAGYTMHGRIIRPARVKLPNK